MLIGETIRVALASLRANKVRSFLTMLGIVIGIASVIAMVALGKGAQQAVADRIARLGTTVLQINAQRVQQGGVGTTNTAKLTMKDVDMIRARSRNVVDVNAQQDRQLQIEWRNHNASVQVTGTQSNFLGVRSFRIDEGRMFTDAEDYGRRRVAVVGADVLPLLGVTDPRALIGEPMRISGRLFTIVGVLAPKGVTGFGDADEQVLIPFGTGRFEIFGTDRINDIWARVASKDSMNAAMAEIDGAVRRAHRLAPAKASDFTVRNQADFLSALDDTTQTFSILLAGVATVSLVVGGIGIMNIMLVSVTERTREIGVRKALGASRRNILLQFLVEALVLCLAGGAVGVALGAGASTAFREWLGWQTVLETSGVIVALVFAVAVGLTFGVWPARRAAVLDPIEALRYE